ncbi:MAG: response regulator transcription factor [Anaerolineae bacterium]|jgi:DNA-binding response OmpR family regulator
MSFKILVADDKIDDETDEISELPDMLRATGYEVRTTSDGNQAYDLVWEYHPDLIVLDIVFENQPVDGTEICEAIRLNGSDIPIILVTAFMTETEQVLRGFEAGADDYVTRPRDNREIIARIRANLPPEVIVANNYILFDYSSRRVWVCRDGSWQEVHLQPLQFELLAVLITNAGLTVPTTTLKDRVWGKSVSDAALAVYIRRLRKKLEPDPDHPVYIKNIRELGYRFNGRPTRASVALLEYGCGSAEGGPANA